MIRMLLVLIHLFVAGCENKSTAPQDVMPSPALMAGELDDTKFFEGTYEDQWEKFKKAMVTNDPDWDWLKFVENPGREGREHEYADVFKDDYTLSLLKDTSYESLDMVEKDGQKYREFSVVAVDAEGTPQGIVYIFREGSYGLMLVGERPL